MACRGGAWRAAAIAGLMIAGLMALAAPAPAHPMGNFSISHYSGLRIGPDGIVVRYLIDMAEVPTFQETQDGALVAEPGHPTLAPYLARKAEQLRAGLRLELEGRRLELAPTAREIAVNPGVGGLPTLKLGMVYRAEWPAAATAGGQLAYRDENFPERVGWKEIVATAAPGIALTSSSVPAVDRSRELSDYPSDLLETPPQVLDARVAFSVPVTVAAPEGSRRGVTEHWSAPVPEPRAALPRATAASGAPALGAARRVNGTQDGGRMGAPVTGIALVTPQEARPAAEQPAEGAGAAKDPASGEAEDAVARGAEPDSRRDAIALQPNRQRSGNGGALADLLVGPGRGLGVVLLAALAAMVLGGLHALEPGHGKTVVAAYLVGARGTARHALLLGLTVTASHTAGVYLLGAVTLYASRYVVPERLYPWLGALSGLMIAGLGCVLFLRRYAGAGDPHAHGHSHGHAHGHEHDPAHGHAHPHAHALGHDQEHGRVEGCDHTHGHGHAHALDDGHDHGHDHGHGDDHGRGEDHGHGHDHGHGDDHDHGRGHSHGHVHDHERAHGHGHTHGWGLGAHHHHVPPAGRVSLRELLALGVSGGIVPCPGALVVLLSAVALGRVGFGLFLILAFSVGLAAVLVAIGLVMVYARRLVTNLKGDGPIVTRWLPLASSAVMTVLGLGIAVQALVAAGIVQIRLG